MSADAQAEFRAIANAGPDPTERPLAAELAEWYARRGKELCPRCEQFVTEHMCNSVVDLVEDHHAELSMMTADRDEWHRKYFLLKNELLGSWWGRRTFRRLVPKLLETEGVP